MGTTKHTVINLQNLLYVIASQHEERNHTFINIII